MSTNLPPAAALLKATIAHTAPYIPQTDNLGGSNDWRDLYYVLDYFTFAVDKAYPQIPCAKGCGHCCDTQLFRVSRAEWETFRQGLDAMPAPARAEILNRAKDTFGPHREALEGLAAHWSAGEPAPATIHDQAPVRCPSLGTDGRCMNYEHRPAICRGYGYFSATVAGTPSLLICRQEGPGWIRHLEATAVEQFPMPNWNPIQRQIDTLNPSGEIKPLPLWLLDAEPTP
ncbi:Flagellin N-methylase [compost metagenome]